MNKEEIIAKYKILKDELGYSPSSTEFYEKTNISKWKFGNIFRYYSDLVKECGDTPKNFFSEKSDLNQIFIEFGKLARKLGKIPSGADWSFEKLSPTTQNIKVIHNIKWSEMPYKFFEFASGKEEWKDIVALIPNRFDDKPNIKINETIKIENFDPELLKFIPPVVQNLIELSGNESHALDFEKKVNLVFQMLGFEVSEYGQGTGRKPDGIAKDNQNRYAILIDAKSRKDSYKMGTEDRKFIEYIKTFSDSLIKSGFSKRYFIIVSSKFDSLPKKAIENIKLETQVPVTFITAKLLLKVLANKIKEPRLFDLNKFQKLLVEDGEISEKKIHDFLKGK